MLLERLEDVDNIINTDCVRMGVLPPLHANVIVFGKPLFTASRLLSEHILFF